MPLISYWVLPIISACMWLGLLLAMLITWSREGKPHYASFDSGQTIAYISDIGAQGLKPLFITGAVIMTVFLDLAFLSERWLRHKGRLARNEATSEKVLVSLSIVFAIMGTAGLILLSIFDTLRHPSLHRLFLLLFMAGYVLSAIFICWEYQRLGVHFREHRILRMSFWIKLVFIIVEAILAVAFGICLYKHITNAGAVLEWIISFIFTFYILTFFLDLWPAVHNKQAHGQETQIEMGTNDSTAVQNGHYANGKPADPRPFM